MMGPHPAVADVRRAIRASLSDLDKGSLVLAACSGGADSLALAACLGFVAPRLGLRAGLVTVDHALQPGSRSRADDLVRLAPGLGLDSYSEAVTVEVGTLGGPEAAARIARYAALDEVSARLGAVILLGHTRDDQAETVLLRLARGSGSRSLSGMAEVSGVYRRPLLGVSRTRTEEACEALGLSPWHDPHNDDPRFTRVKVRQILLPLLESELGPGIADALARTARLCRDDADALDDWADRVYAEARDLGTGLSTALLAELPAAVRRRVIHRAAVAAGSPPSALAAVHIEEAERLITSWTGQKGVDLPGGVGVVRRYGRLMFTSSLS
ncbi:tRNA lysidine(34) synthetase TilS [Herbidospora galbida]|uniref:tRNA(Ile)-lysidine synthase n=1 Tax=Herbidospora galbida TaxID=2575442 RepID=A0A4U3MAX0_9ACTN|nr:tRNA lysidine(34) synthetase TilS [Herbidospora galbida]TKK86298.1 tRNA lysidine(34) synthetase TilS [Herbidospora galbida]